MTETIISFETAKLAKEEGFDWESSGLYDEKCILGINHHDYRRLFTNTKEDTYNIAAPTQSLLQKWLREVHNIEIIVHPKEHSSLGFMYVVDVFFIDQLNNISYSGVYSLYKTYEEALETGLQEAIKLIK